MAIPFDDFIGKGETIEISRVVYEICGNFLLEEVMDEDLSGDENIDEEGISSIRLSRDDKLRVRVVWVNSIIVKPYVWIYWSFYTFLLAKKAIGGDIYWSFLFSGQQEHTQEAQPTKVIMRDTEVGPSSSRDHKLLVTASYYERNIIPLRKAHRRPRKPTNNKTPRT
ncbi:hypothetical protein M9H77_34289 [Catharanthus roseus]|uniref:Uncharacterized protein n=1 Tax=Catharanthus roseus TaxID=4058 RepID=A0ACB9ZMH1_CATRO|nr:hypothetical protein M9H77_34289 [Catharanthus roseus]